MGPKRTIAAGHFTKSQRSPASRLPQKLQSVPKKLCECIHGLGHNVGRATLPPNETAQRRRRTQEHSEARRCRAKQPGCPALGLSQNFITTGTGASTWIAL